MLDGLRVRRRVVIDRAEKGEPVPWIYELLAEAKRQRRFVEYE
jgi:hypothetical protein